MRQKGHKPMDDYKGMWHTWTIGVTGHRPSGLLGYSADGEYAVLRERLSRRIEDIANDGSVRVITGGAQGADQLAFWAAEDAKAAGTSIENVVYVPFDGQASRWHSDGMFGSDAYARMLAAADDVRIITPDIDTYDTAAVRAAMMARNRAIVDDSDMIIAITMNGIVPHERSGTASTVRYATGIHVTIDDFRVSDVLPMVACRE